MGFAPTVTVGPALDASLGRIRVNATSAGWQTLPSATPLEGGGFVAAWTLSANGPSIYARVFAPGGTPLGGDILVSEIPPNVLGLPFPKVAALDGGGFVVAWSSSDEGGTYHVSAQRFDAVGQPLGGAIAVGTPAFGMFSIPSVEVAGLPGGGFVVTWDDRNGSDNVHGRVYDVSGAPLGNAFQINTHTAEGQWLPKITALADGHFVVAWQSADQDGDRGGIYGQLFDASGNAVDAEFRINTVTVGDQRTPDIEALANGGFVLAWTTSDAPDEDIMDGFHPHDYIGAQIYGADGVPVGDELFIGPGRPGFADPEAPLVAAMPDGGFVVAWHGYYVYGDAFEYNVHVQRFGADGSAYGDQFQLEPPALTSGILPTARSIMFTEDGELVVIVSNRSDSSPNDPDAFAYRYLIDDLAVAQVPLTLGNSIALTDDLGSNVVTVTLSVDYGLLTIATAGSGVAAAGNGTASVTLTGAVDQLNALLAGENGAISFLADPGPLPPGSAKLTIEVADNEGYDASATAAITFLADIYAAVARPDAATTTEAATRTGNVFADNGSGADFDVDGPALAVAAVNGSAAAVGTTITLPSGALLTVQADGDYLYDPNGQFNALPAPGSGASNLTAQDSFTYTLANGGTATVTLTITGLDSNDMLVGTAGNDTLHGGIGNDTITGAGGRDSLYGEEGDDTFIVGEVVPSGEIYDGGVGFDTLEFRPYAGVPSGSDAFYNVLFTDFSSLERFQFASTSELGVDVLVFATRLPASGVTELVGGAGRDVFLIDPSNLGPPAAVVSATMPALTVTNWTSSPTPHLASPLADMLSLSAGIPSFGIAPNYMLYAREGLPATQFLSGSTGNDTLVGSSGVEYLSGLGGGADQLDGGGGNDVLEARNINFLGTVTQYTWAGGSFNGGSGADIFSVGGVVNFAGTLSSIEHIYLQPAFTSTAPNGSGSQAPAHLSIGALAMASLPANLALSGTGAITVNLAPGDSYNAAGFVVAGGSSITHVINGSSAGDTIRGLQVADTIYGNGGNDTLVGGAGDDTLVGGTGDDRYYVDTAIDVVIEGAAEGANDHVLASASYALGAGVYAEKLTTTSDAGTAAINLTGNAFVQRIVGNAGANVLDGKGGVDTLVGLGGNDWYYVDNALDVVVEGAAEGATDRVFASVSYTLGAGVYVEQLTTSSNGATTAINLTGNELANRITGNAGANVLDGRGGDDTLVGLGGNDSYYVDSAADVVVEGAAEGTADRVLASVSYTLGAGVYVEQLATTSDAATTAMNLTGNELANQITGNAGANLLNGGAGADTLVGGGGDDRYLVDNALDTVTEGAAEGANDQILASVSYTLGAGAFVEKLTTSNDAGTAAINLTGNAFAQLIVGNAAANVLDGSGAADTMTGLGGNDWYYVDNALDVVIEGAAEGATDRIFASVSYTLGAGVYVEQLTTSSNGATTPINLTGNELANTISGNAGANVLDGKGGADTLVGLAGEDAFAFTTALGGGNVDAISGFVVVDDTIRLDDAVFTGLAAGVLAAGAFATGAAATETDDRIIYDSNTGALLFDADGLGGAAAVQFATLNAGLSLTSADFLVI